MLLIERRLNSDSLCSAVSVTAIRRREVVRGAIPGAYENGIDLEHPLFNSGLTFSESAAFCDK
jgi:hypothetical protein